MDIDNYWSFFSHSTAPRTLKNILKKRYGIDCTGKVEPDIQKIYQLTLDCCKSLGGIDSEGATDQNFFPDISSNRDTQLLDYLVVDALFHIRKEIAFQDKSPIHKAFNHFFEEQGKTFSRLGIEMDIPTPKTFRKYLEQLLFQNIFHDFLKTSKGSDDSKKHKYEIPKFMDRLLFLLIGTIRQNPYCAQSEIDLFSSLETYFTENEFFETVQQLYHKDKGNQYLANYLTARIFDVDTVVYLASELRQWDRSIRLKKISSYLFPLFFVPNIFGKRAYCDFILDILKGQRKVIVRSDYWKNPNKKKKSFDIAPSLQTDLHNLKRCKRYLLFLSTIYLPLVNHCFYVFLRKSCQDKDSKVALKKADHLLISYLNDRNQQPWYENRINDWKERMKKLDEKEKEFFVQMYFSKIQLLSNPQRMQDWQSAISIDYAPSKHPYQHEIIKTILKYKVEKEPDILPSHPINTKNHNN